ncbi:MAG: hypothetical protein IJO84_11970, partial [Butyricimonas sp.]|nr:hypothetical protein [Butyricimonas sp.]
FSSIVWRDKPLDFVATDISLLVEQVNFFRIRQYIHTSHPLALYWCASSLTLLLLFCYSIALLL